MDSNLPLFGYSSSLNCFDLIFSEKHQFFLYSYNHPNILQISYSQFDSLIFFNGSGHLLNLYNFCFVFIHPLYSTKFENPFVGLLLVILILFILDVCTSILRLTDLLIMSVGCLFPQALFLRKHVES